jgi:hypothetical protein
MTILVLRCRRLLIRSNGLSKEAVGVRTLLSHREVWNGLLTSQESAEEPCRSCGYVELHREVRETCHHARMAQRGCVKWF